MTPQEDIAQNLRTALKAQPGEGDYDRVYIHRFHLEAAARMLEIAGRQQGNLLGLSHSLLRVLIDLFAAAGLDADDPIRMWAEQLEGELVDLKKDREFLDAG